MKAAVVIAALVLMCGCKAAPPEPPALPVHEYRGAMDTYNQMVERSALVRTLSGTAALTLRRGDGAEVRVDAAFAARPPEALRIRAWKFDRAVADWTLRPDGVWAWQAESGEGDAPTGGPWTSGHGEAWPLIFGLVVRDAAHVVVHGSGETFTIRREIVGGVLEADVDGRTQTVTRCRIQSTSGVEVQRLTLGRYALVNGFPFPMRVTASGQAGDFQLDCQEVQINEELAENALKPPARARRLH